MRPSGHGIQAGTPRGQSARYSRAKDRYEALRDELRTAVVAELRKGGRPADLSRDSGWDREYLRRIKKAADEQDAEVADSPTP